ncbi:MAG: hypothetical protein ABW122_10405, partial [Ilumatobacteraceae bacterium]
SGSVHRSIVRTAAAPPARTVQRASTADGTTSASSLWDSLTSGASQLYDRFVGPGTASTNDAPAPQPTVAPVQAVATPPSNGTADAGGLDIERHFDRLLELLEDRIISELERRGGRFRGGF